MTNRGLTVLLTLCLVAVSVSAQDTSRFDVVHARMQRFVDEGELAGAVVAVGSSKGVLYLNAIGQQSLEAKTPMRKDTLFRIASMTKPITALAIMMQVDEGKLAVEDAVEKHLPEFRGQMVETVSEKPSMRQRVAPKRPIQIRDLLTHTSGLPGGYPHGMSDLYTNRQHTLTETTAALAKTRLVFEPGTQWVYCNPGIDTLGRIVEVVSGQRFEDFLQARLFRPLGMKDTTFYPTPDQMDRLAVTYDKPGKQLARAQKLLIELPADAKHPIPAGGLFSTAEDLAKLYQMMLLRGVHGQARLLSEKSVTVMTQTQTGDLKTGFVPGMSFGYGWAVVKEPQGVTAMLSPGTYGHGGAFGTQAWIDPKQDLFLILLIQRTGLANADDSVFRKEFQQRAVEAMRR